MIYYRHSEIKDFRQCPLKWRLGWAEGWVSDPSAAASLGSAWHYLMAALFRHLKLAQERQRQPDMRRIGKAVAKLIPEAHPDEDVQELLIWMLAGYIEHWGPHSEWQIVDIEQEIEIPLKDQDGVELEVGFRAHIDLVVRVPRLRNRLVVVDHKTVGRLDGQVIIDLDDQLGLYTLAVQRHYREKVIYAAWNQVRRERLKTREMGPEERFRLWPSSRTPVELAQIERDLVLTIDEIQRVAADPELPRSAPNPRVCSWSCDFVEAHIAARRSGGRDLESMLRAHGLYQDRERMQAVPTE